MMRFLVCFLGLMAVSFPVLAQSSWEDLIRDVQTPFNAQPSEQSRPAPSGGGSNSSPMTLPDVSSDVPVPTQTDPGDTSTVGVKYIFTYQCENPEFPRCLTDMKRFKDYMDVEHCKELTKSYLSSVASYNRCIDRRTKKHARAVVDYFNCHANDEQDCPSLYAD